MELKEVIHLYLGCEVRHMATSVSKYKLIEVFIGGYCKICDVYNNKHTSIVASESILPILRPLSDMTEDEENEVAKFCFGSDDFIITKRGMGYDEQQIHESVKCIVIETFCEHPMVKNWVKAALIQVDYKDDNQPIIISRFSEMGNNLNDDLIEQPFQLTRYLLSRHFDLFGLIESGQAIDKTTT